MKRGFDISWTDIRNGDDAAYKKLYEAFAEPLYGYGMKIMADEAIVSDAIQALFINIFEKRNRLSTPDSIASYMFRSFKNLLINELNSRKTQGNIGMDKVSNEDYDFDMELDVESAMISSETEDEKFKLFQRELDKLTKQQREMLYLKYYKELDTDEISEVMGVSKRTVYNTVNNALSRLRSNKELAKFMNEPMLVFLLGLSGLYNF